MTKEELRYFEEIKKWVGAARAAITALENSSLSPDVRKALMWATGPDPHIIMSNFDWLITVAERDHKLLRHRSGVRALTQAVEEKMKKP